MRRAVWHRRFNSRRRWNMAPGAWRAAPG